MTEQVKVGQTWMSSNKGLFRVTAIRDTAVDMVRIGRVTISGQEIPEPHSEFTFHLTTIQRNMRVVSRNAKKFDAYMATL